MSFFNLCKVKKGSSEVNGPPLRPPATPHRRNGSSASCESPMTTVRMSPTRPWPHPRTTWASVGMIVLLPKANRAPLCPICRRCPACPAHGAAPLPAAAAGGVVTPMKLRGMPRPLSSKLQSYSKVKHVATHFCNIQHLVCPIIWK